jgi:hypothetical protein
VRLKWMELLREGEGAGAGTPPADPAAPPAGVAGEGDLPAGDTPPATPPKRTSIYDDAGIPEPGKEGSPAWPEDWRDQFVQGIEDPGEREKALNQMKRYQSPAEVAKANLALRQRISSGEYTRGLPQDATPEQVAEWRAEQGLPEDPSGYELPIAMDGKPEEMTDEQKSVYEGWQGVFHENNVPPALATKLTEYANDVFAAQMEAMAEHDAKAADASEDALRTDWSTEFRNNVQMNNKLLQDSFGEEGAQNLLNARMADGTLVKHSVEVAKFLNKMARESGLSSSWEGGEVVGGQGLLDRKAEIEGIMKTDLAAYQKLKPEYEQILQKLEGQGKLSA